MSTATDQQTVSLRFAKVSEHAVLLDLRRILKRRTTMAKNEKKMTKNTRKGKNLSL